MARSGLIPSKLSYAALCAGVYAIVGVGWITLSDRLVEALIPDVAQASLIQSYKGWITVLGTAVLIYFLLRHVAGLRDSLRALPASDTPVDAAAPPGLPLLAQLVLLVLTVSTPLCALLAVSIYQSAVVEVESAKRLVEDLARVTARDTAKFVASTAHTLDSMAQRPLIRALDAAHCDPMLFDVPVINRSYINALVLRANGDLVCSVLPLPPDTKLKLPQSAHHRRVLSEGKFVLGQPVAGVLSGRPVVIASAPVRDAFGLVAGTVNLSIDLESLRPVVRPLLPKSGVVGLINSNGLVVYGETPNLIGTDGRRSEGIRKAIELKSGEAQGKGLDGRLRSFHFLPVEGTDWIAIAGLPTSEIYAEARASAWRGGVLGLIIILFAAMVGTWMSRRIARPILAIADTARRVAGGDVVVRVPEGGSREVREVAQQFNRMLDELPQIAGELRDSEQRYKNLFETSPSCIFVVVDGRIAMINPAGARVYGAQSPEEMVGMQVADLVHPDDRADMLAGLDRLLSTHEERAPRELRHVRLDGRVIDVEVTPSPFEYRGQAAVLTQLRDITARKLAEARIGRLSAIYAALSRGSAAMSRERTREGLCRAVCNIIVEQGGFVTAGIRLYDADTNTYVPVASHGPVSAWVGERAIGAMEKGSRMVRAVDRRVTYVLNDVFAEPDGQHGLEDMRRLGIRSMAVLPLLIDEEDKGGLSVFAGEVGVFDGELLALLEEMARNLSFAFAKLKGEQSLRDSEERYRLLVESAPDAIAVLIDGEVIMVNSAAVRLYGATAPEQLIGRHGLQMTHPDYHEKVRQGVSATAQTPGSISRYEVKHVRLDGSVFDAEVVRSRFLLRGQNALQVIVRDITARKAAELHISRLTRLYATLSRTSEAISRATTPQELCSSVCRIAVEQGGLITAFIAMLNPERDAALPWGSHGQLAGMVGEQIVPLGIGTPTAQGPLGIAIAEGQTVVSNDLLADPRAAAFHADLSRTGIRAVAACPLWLDGEVAGALVVYAGELDYFDNELIELLQEMAQNISFGLAKLAGDAAHAASEAALRDSEARYRRLFDVTPLCIYVRQDDKVVMINPAGVELLGARSADQILGRSVFDIVHPDYHQLMQRRLDFVSSEGRPVPAAEFRNVRLDGTAIDTESVVTPVEYQGRPAAQIIVADISARRTAERAMRRLNAELEQRVQQRTGELQKVNQELSEFSYIVSHDLKAPLRGIASLVGWLEQDHGDKLGAEGRELLRLMSSRSRRMHRLIEDILHFSRLGRTRENAGKVDLDRLVHEVVDSLEVPAHIEMRIAALPVVVGDETRLRQVFQNLISNAVKFMDKQAGLVEVGAEALEEAPDSNALPDPRARRPDDEAPLPARGAAPTRFWCFHVADNGPGIAQRHHERIFEIFHTLNPRDDPDSTGIGLTVVKKIIELQGGRIWVESDTGKGARFMFTMPRREVVHDDLPGGGKEA